MNWDCPYSIHMNRKLIHRLSLTLTAGLFLALAQGAVEAGRETGAPFHLAFGIAVGVLTVVWVAGVRKVRPEAFPLALSVLAAVGLSGLTGTAADPAVKVAHAAFSHLAFALAAAGAAMTSDSWEARLGVADGGFPTLRSLAWLTPAAVVMQVALGAAYRHEMTGLIPHVSWAFVAAMFVIMTAAFTMTQCGEHPAFEERAQNGLAPAPTPCEFPGQLEPRRSGLCAFEEHAQNGLAPAPTPCEFPGRLEPRRSGLCAFEERAQNGLAPAPTPCEFPGRLEPRRSGLCALKKISIWLISITGVQLILGVVALIGRLAENEAARSAWMVVSTTSHVLTGAVVLALTMALSAQTLRHVEPAAETNLTATGQNG
ncbi:MAG: hypothetical protein C0504_15150 [Candidatus Solibacter sp.]|nr:hypothetical protein [Candidatus Solibacter sp.]